MRIRLTLICNKREHKVRCLSVLREAEEYEKSIEQSWHSFGSLVPKSASSSWAQS